MVLNEVTKLFGLGYGVVGIVLFASTLITSGALLWALEKRFADLAQ